MKNRSVKNIFLNLLMLNGNKCTSEKLFIKSLKSVQKDFNKKKINDLIKLGLINSCPFLFLKKIKRKRKQTVEFPFMLTNKLRLFYGIKNLIKTCLTPKNQAFANKLKNELVNSSKNLSKSVKEKKDLHKNVVLKKKFANYRWF